MRLLIAEKPKMARDIAAALGINSKEADGVIKGADLLITSSLGHVLELADPAAYDPGHKTWTLADLPILPKPFKTQPTKKGQKRLKLLVGLMNRSDVTEIINACDAGREGEYIFDLIHQKANPGKPVLRMWYSAATRSALRNAYENLQPSEAFAGLRAAARCRSQADWLVGINGTRALTLYARAAGVPIEKVAPIGRIQTPVLNLLYARRKAIDTFSAEPFWKISGRFKTKAGDEYDGTLVFRQNGSEIDRIPSAEQAEQVIAALERHRSGTLVRVTTSPHATPSPQLFDLTGLQAEANRRFGFDLTHTLKIAQALYEDAKCLSYPRTGSQHLTTEDRNQLPTYLAAAASYSPAYAKIHHEISINNAYAKDLGLRYVDDSAVDDHSALTPTDSPPHRPLSEDEEKIYDLVVRRTFAVFFPPKKTEVTVAYTLVGRCYFKTEGRRTISRGWERICPPAKASPDSTVPPLQVDDHVAVVAFSSQEGKTRPPAEYTPASLIEAMKTAGRDLDDTDLVRTLKDQGLGTAATRAEAIQKLLRYKLIERRKGKLLITYPGVAVVESVADESLKSAQLTGEWEAKLAQMARGDYQAAPFMKEITDFTRELITDLRKRCPTGSDGPPPPASTTTLNCPRDGAPLLLRKNREGKHYLACSNYFSKDAPCKTSFDSDASGNPLAGFCDQCSSPLRTTRAGTARCFRCDAEPAEASLTCERCGEASYRLHTFRDERSGSRREFMKCPGCQMTRNADALNTGVACPTSACAGAMIEQTGPYGPYRFCTHCDHTEKVPQ